MTTNSAIFITQGVPKAATIDPLPNEVTDGTISLTWSEPENNGRVITQYTVYQRIVADGKPGEWKELKIITDVSVRELKVQLEGGKVYEFAVTAANEFGESLKEEEKIMRVKASAGMWGYSTVCPFEPKLSQPHDKILPNILPNFKNNLLNVICNKTNYSSTEVNYGKNCSQCLYRHLVMFRSRKNVRYVEAAGG